GVGERALGGVAEEGDQPRVRDEAADPLRGAGRVEVRGRGLAGRALRRRAVEERTVAVEVVDDLAAEAVVPGAAEVRQAAVADEVAGLLDRADVDIRVLGNVVVEG